MIKPIKSTQAYKICKLENFDFKTTNDLTDLNEIIGQERALESIKISTKIKK